MDKIEKPSSFDEYLSNPEISKLNLTPQEIAIYRPYIVKQIDDEIKCQNLSEIDKCINPDFRHIKLFRDEKTQKINIGYITCPKAKYHKHWLWLDKPTDEPIVNWSINNLISNIKALNNIGSNKEELIYEHLRPIAKKIQNNKISNCKGLYVFGDYGVGKSIVLYLFANMCVKRFDLYAAFVNTGMLYERIKQTFNKDPDIKKENQNDVLDLVKKADILVLDDIGVVNSKYFYTSILWNIIDYRYRYNKLTFFTSNFSLTQLKSYMIKELNISPITTGRIIDRIEALTSYKPFKLIDKNFRKK